MDNKKRLFLGTGLSPKEAIERSKHLSRDELSVTKRLEACYGVVLPPEITVLIEVEWESIDAGIKPFGLLWTLCSSGEQFGQEHEESEIFETDPGFIPVLHLIDENNPFSGVIGYHRAALAEEKWHACSVPNQEEKSKQAQLIENRIVDVLHLWIECKKQKHNLKIHKMSVEKKGSSPQEERQNWRIYDEIEKSKGQIQRLSYQIHQNETPLMSLEQKWERLRSVLARRNEELWGAGPSQKSFGEVVDLLISWGEEEGGALEYAETKMADWTSNICSTSAPFLGFVEEGSNGRMGYCLIEVHGITSCRNTVSDWSPKTNGSMIDGQICSFFHLKVTRLFKSIKILRPNEDYDVWSLQNADLRNVEKLDLGKVRFQCEGACALFSNPMPRLKEIDIWDAHIGDLGFEAILKADLPNLERLIIHSSITSDGFRKLVHANFPKLIELDVSSREGGWGLSEDEEITPDDLYELTKCKFPLLEKLVLPIDQVDDECIALLHHTFPNLKWLLYES